MKSQNETHRVVVILCIIAFHTTFSVTAQITNCLPPPSGVTAWWPMDGSASDVAGTNNPVATNGLSFVSSAVGSGVSFASGGYIDIPNTADLSSQHFTLEAWVRPDGPGPNNDSFGSVIIQHIVTATVNELGLWWRASDGKFLFSFGNNPADRVQSTNSFPVGHFYHVAGTYDGAVFTLYVNGSVEGQLSRVKTIVYSSSVPWTIGATRTPFRTGSFPRTWDGIIDEVTVYNRSLVASEIVALFASGSSGKCRPVKILSARMQNDREFQVTVCSQAGLSYLLQASTDFSAWDSIATNSAIGTALDFTDPSATNYAYRYYRARQR